MGGDATCLWHSRRHRVHQRLYDGMVGGVQMVGQWKLTFALTVKRVITRGRHYPIAPADIFKVDVHLVSHAHGVFRVFPSSSSGRPFTPLYPSGDISNVRFGVFFIVRICVQDWLEIRPCPVIFVIATFDADVMLYIGIFRSR